MEKKQDNGKRMNRGKFLGFLGKIGILSLIPGLPAFGAPKTGGGDKKFLHPGLTDIRCGKLFRSPVIKGKTLSRAALTATLASENLENIRDLMTGRFFGKIAQDVFSDGYKPFISWNLGAGDSDSGCFYYADSDPSSPSDIDHCGMYITWQEDTGEVVVNVSGRPGVLGCTGRYDMVGQVYTPPKCPEECTNDCPNACSGVCDNDCGNQCSGTYCEGGYCNPQSKVNLKEMMAFQDDMFVNEILEILETTDIRTVRTELKNVIFSDEVLNMGLEHFVTSAYDSINP